MAAQEFEDRVARLEEHLVKPTAEFHLKRAEGYLARGPAWKGHAESALLLAKLARKREERDDA